MKTKVLIPLLTLINLLAVSATAQVNYAVSGGTAYVGRSPGASGAIVIASTFNGYPVTGIGEWAFLNCTNLTSVTIPDSVTDIGQQAFKGCNSLTNVTIGNGVTIIRILAFSGTSLTSVNLPHSLAFIAYDAFGGCTRLTNLSVDAANPTLSSLNGVLFNKAQTTLIMFPPGRGSYVISDSVTNIGTRAFENCTSLTNVTIPNSITSIAEGVFYNCTGLTSANIPNSVTSIGPTAFSGCTSLTSVTIPNSVTNIGSSAFSRCTSLAGVTIPNSITRIETQAFSACGRLAVVTIPNSVTSIGVVAFMNCTNLASVTIPSSVTRIEDAAFSGCARLTNFTFLGNAPVLVRGFYEGGWFANVGAGARAYYYCGTTGWGATYGPLPTVMLCPPQIASGSAGMKPGGFGFTLTFLTNHTIVVEASTDLVNWQPIWTNTPPGASAEFVDPEWLQHPNRFYRARSD